MARSGIADNYFIKGRDSTTTLINNCSSLTNVDDANSDGTCGVSLNTTSTHIKEGTGCWQIDITEGTAIGQGAEVILSGLNLDLSNVGEICFKLGFDITAADRVTDCRIVITLITGAQWWSNYRQLPTQLSGVDKSGDDVLVCKFDDFNAASGSFDISDVNMIKIDFRQLTDTNAKRMYVDGIYAGMRSQTQLLMSFDDGNETQYDFLRGHLNSRELVSTFFVNGSVVGDAGFMTLAEMKELQSDGHLISSHSYTGTNWTTLTRAEMVTEWENNDAWLAANNFNAGRPYFAYVQGGFNDNALSVMAAKGVKIARSVETGQGGVVPDGSLNPYAFDEHLVRTIDLGVGATETASAALAILDDCISRGLSMNIIGHKFVASPTLSTEFSTTEMQTLLDGVKARKDKGLLTDRTFKQFYESLDNPARS